MDKAARPTVLLLNQSPDVALPKKLKKPTKKVEVLKQGYLSKQGGARGGRKNWKRRFFVIKEDCLYYYTDHEQTTLLGVMPLLQSKLLDISSDVSPAPAFIDGKVCYDCKTKFTMTNRVHHCRHCSHPYCDKCCSSMIPVTKFGFNNPVRTCHTCYQLIAKELETQGVRFGEDDDMNETSFTLPSVKKEHLFALKNSERELWVHGETQQETSDWIQTIKTIMSQEGGAGPGGRDGPQGSKKNEWEIDYSQIKVGDLVGSGAFGDVYGGTLWGTEIAVKTLRTDQFDSTEKLIEELKKEVDILAQLRHPNVILYMGVCGLPNVCLLTEWCKRGSLYDILHDHSIHINAKRMVDLAMGIAQGMNYLHSLEHKIIHRDLKSHNVLVSANWQVKVADFGLSHIRSQRTKRMAATASVGNLSSSNANSANGDQSVKPEDTHYGVFGTPEWMAPEVMEGQAYNEKIDVYSFGILLTEIVSRQMPFHDKYNIRSYHDVWDAVLDDGAIPTIPKWCDFFFQDIIIACLDRDPSRRPSFAQIIPMLRQYSGLSDSDYLIKYDLPRIGEMMQSFEPTVQALAVSEIADLMAKGNIVRIEEPVAQPADQEEDDAFDFGRRVRSGAKSNPLYLEKEQEGEPYRLSDPEAAHILQRCAALLTSTSSQVQLSACRALANLLQCADKVKKQIDIGVVLSESGAIQPLLDLLSSKTKVIVKESSRALLLITKELPVNSQIIFKGFGPEKLALFKTIVAEDLVQERERCADLAKLIQKQEIFAASLSDFANQETRKAPAFAPVRRVSAAGTRKKPTKMKKFQFGDQRDANDENPELREAMEARMRLDDDWLSLLKSKPSLSSKWSDCYATSTQIGYLLFFNNNEWKLCFGVLNERELRMFEGVDDDPEDPFTTIKLDDVYGEPVRVKQGIINNQPFAFTLTDVDFEITFSCSDEETVKLWVTKIQEKKQAEDVVDAAEIDQLAAAGNDDYCRRCKSTPGHPGISCQEYAIQRRKTRALQVSKDEYSEKADKLEQKVGDKYLSPPSPMSATSEEKPTQAAPGEMKVWAAPFLAHWKRVDHLGYLTKKKKTFNRWNQAFFVLVGAELHYYPSHASDPATPHNTLYICSKQGKPFGRGVAVSNKREHCFSIEDPNRTWHLACATEEDLAAWINAINENIGTICAASSTARESAVDGTI